MTVFHSPYKALTLQDGPAKAGQPGPVPWATFENGRFETTDQKIADKIRRLPDDYHVTEEPEPDPEQEQPAES